MKNEYQNKGFFFHRDATLTEKEHIPLYRLVTFEAAF